MHLGSSVKASFFSEVTTEAQLEGRSDVEKFAFHLADTDMDGTLSSSEQAAATTGHGEEVSLKELGDQIQQHVTLQQSDVMSLRNAQNDLQEASTVLNALNSSHDSALYLSTPYSLNVDKLKITTQDLAKRLVAREELITAYSKL